MRYIFTLLVCLVFALPAFAQSEAEDDRTLYICQTDFDDLIADLEGIATALTPDSDVTDAYNDLNMLITALDNLSANCFRIGLTGPAVIGIDTTRYFTSDELISFEYPASYIIDEDFAPDATLFVNSLDVVPLFESSSPVFPDGEYGFGFLQEGIYNPDEDFRITLDTDPQEWLDELFLFPDDIIGLPEIRLFNDYPGAVVRYTSESLFATIISVQLPNDSIVSFIGGSSEADSDFLYELLIFIADTLRYTP